MSGRVRPRWCDRAEIVLGFPTCNGSKGVRAKFVLLVNVPAWDQQGEAFDERDGKHEPLWCYPVSVDLGLEGVDVQST